MDNDILNLEQVIELLGVSEKTLIKLLREEHMPARKIGREWRFSKAALVDWLASGDSADYINLNEQIIVSEDIKGRSYVLFEKIDEALATITENNYNIKPILKEIDKDIKIPDDATLRISYKQKRDVEKLEFKVFWESRD